MTTILVTGATGNTGSGLVPALKKAGVNVRALVRDEAKAQSLRTMGVEAVIGDLDQPSTIAPALDGVDKIYLLTWNGPTQEQQVYDVLAAAKRVGTPHIIRHSMWGSARSRIVQQCARAEEAIRSSGLPWTLLKPTFFMQNLMMAAQTVASSGTIYWDTSDGKIAMIDVRDVIDVAAAVLTQDGHESQSYTLTGPAAISLHDVATSFSNVLGKDVQYVNVPHAASFEAMTGMGMPAWIAEGYGELMEGFSKGFANSTTNCVEALAGHPARSIEQFVRDYASVFDGAR